MRPQQRPLPQASSCVFCGPSCICLPMGTPCCAPPHVSPHLLPQQLHTGQSSRAGPSSDWSQHPCHELSVLLIDCIPSTNEFQVNYKNEGHLLDYSVIQENSMQYDKRKQYWFRCTI